MIPIVAIVGRPNVGKSTLFNRLTGQQLAIVHDSPGVTRDRNYSQAFLNGRELILVDTGGFDPHTDDPMGAGIARHVVAAIEEADVVMCILDGQGPATEADFASVQLLRESDKPVIYIANRVDNQRQANEATELYSLGLEDLIFVSALHGRGLAELEYKLGKALPPPVKAEEREENTYPHVALVGRPNAGKSSTLNYLAHSEKSLVDDKPGTTRDPVDVDLVYKNKPYRIVDTAGIRRKARVDGEVELASVMRSIRAASRADVVVLVVDATEGIAEQDARLVGLCAERGRALVVAMNKMDLLTPEEQQKALADAKTKLHFSKFTPILRTSAKDGKGVSRLMRTVDEAFSEFYRRVPTGELNRFFEGILLKTPPPTKGGRAPRLYYITQAQVGPPLFVVMASYPENLEDHYMRYVQNQLRTTFNFNSVPVKVKYKPRRRRGSDTEQSEKTGKTRAKSNAVAKAKRS